MSEAEENLDVVNEEGEVIKTLPRSVIHGDPSMMHRVVHVLVFNSAGSLLLQKRSMNKDVAPGKWDTSVGGHIDAGETIIEALNREMEEELGVTSCEPEILYTYIHSNPYETELVYTHSCIYDSEIRFSREEIDEVRFWGEEDIRRNMGQGVFSDNFEHEYSAWMKFVSMKKGK
ncbi:MAG: NUDIX domain-containing protein [Nitrospirae bacterium]|nr:NUDIX domain-containing protein [Nitrospirota bacterium]